MKIKVVKGNVNLLLPKYLTQKINEHDVILGRENFLDFLKWVKENNLWVKLINPDTDEYTWVMFLEEK
jgi:hypothetical protein